MRKCKKLPTLISSVFLIGMTVPAYGDDPLSPQELEEYITDNAQAIVDAGEDRVALQRQFDKKLKQLREEKEQLKTAVDKLATRLDQLTQALEQSTALTKAYAETKASEAEKAAKTHADTKVKAANKHAETKASEAEKAANKHAETKASEAEQAAKDHADTKASAAEQTAKDHADTKASAAEKAAKTHAETKANAAEKAAKKYASQITESFKLPSDYFKFLTDGDGWSTRCCDMGPLTCPSSHPRKIGTWVSIDSGGGCGYCKNFTLCMK